MCLYTVEWTEVEVKPTHIKNKIAFQRWLQKKKKIKKKEHQTVSVNLDFCRLCDSNLLCSGDLGKCWLRNQRLHTESPPLRFHKTNYKYLLADLSKEVIPVIRQDPPTFSTCWVSKHSPSLWSATTSRLCQIRKAIQQPKQCAQVRQKNCGDSEKHECNLQCRITRWCSNLSYIFRLLKLLAFDWYP